MKYWRCKCGRIEAWGSDSPALCVVCESCGTTLAWHPDLHIEPKDHVLDKRYSSSTGEFVGYRCRNCDQTFLVAPIDKST